MGKNNLQQNSLPVALPPKYEAVILLAAEQTGIEYSVAELILYTASQRVADSLSNENAKDVLKSLVKLLYTNGMQNKEKRLPEWDKNKKDYNTLVHVYELPSMQLPFIVRELLVKQDSITRGGVCLALSVHKYCNGVHPAKTITQVITEVISNCPAIIQEISEHLVLVRQDTETAGMAPAM